MGRRAAPDRSVCAAGPRTELCRCRLQRIRYCRHRSGPADRRAFRSQASAPAGTYPTGRRTIRRMLGRRLPRCRAANFRTPCQCSRRCPAIGPDAPPLARNPVRRPVAGPRRNQLGLSASRSSRSQWRCPRLLHERSADRVVRHGRQFRCRGHYRAAASSEMRRFRIPHRQRVLHQRALRQRSIAHRSGTTNRTRRIFRSTSSRYRNWHW